MSGALLTTYIVIVTILLSHPADNECCSMTTNEIVTLMSQNADFRQDPCYLEWKAAEDEKLTQIWTRREQLEKSIGEHNRKTMEYEAQEREMRQRGYASNATVPEKKRGEMWKALGILVGILIAICCFAVCVAVLQSGTEDDPTTNIPQSGHPPVQLTSAVTNDTLGNQSTPYSSISDDHNFSAPIVIPTSSQESSVPLMPRRQDSLPSYDEAVKMPPSAPQKECVT